MQTKSGIDFFPLDTYIDKKLELIEAEFGIKGFGIVVRLYQQIYGQEGYYLEWTKEVALLFSHKIGEGESVVSEIVRASIQRGIFDQKIFEEYGVLTSHGIQKRYFEIVKRRKNLEINGDILLVNADSLPVDVCIKRKNASISEKNVNISEQSKVKESKVKESIERVRARAREDQEDADFNQWFDAYPRKIAIAEAYKAFLAVANERPPVEELIAAVERQKSSPQWQEAGGKYIQSPARWLRQHGWLNQEPEVQADFAKPSRQEGKRLTFWDVGEQMKRGGEV